MLSIGLEDFSLLELRFPSQLCKLSGAEPIFNLSHTRSTTAWGFNLRWIWEAIITCQIAMF